MAVLIILVSLSRFINYPLINLIYLSHRQITHKTCALHTKASTPYIYRVKLLSNRNNATLIMTAYFLILLMTAQFPPSSRFETIKLANRLLQLQISTTVHRKTHYLSCKKIRRKYLQELSFLFIEKDLHFFPYFVPQRHTLDIILTVFGIGLLQYLHLSQFFFLNIQIGVQIRLKI